MANVFFCVLSYELNPESKIEANLCLSSNFSKNWLNDKELLAQKDYGCSDLIVWLNWSIRTEGE